MKARFGALVAAVAAAAGTASAAVWAKRKNDQEDTKKKQTRKRAGAPATPTKPADVPADTSATAQAAVASEGDGADDLTRLKGIGAVSAERLAGIGVTTFRQLADWSDGDIDAAGAQIKVSAERIRREDWVGQARSVVGS